MQVNRTGQMVPQQTENVNKSFVAGSVEKAAQASKTLGVPPSNLLSLTRRPQPLNIPSATPNTAAWVRGVKNVNTTPPLNISSQRFKPALARLTKFIERLLQIPNRTPAQKLKALDLALKSPLKDGSTSTLSSLVDNNHEARQLVKDFKDTMETQSKEGLIKDLEETAQELESKDKEKNAMLDHHIANLNAEVSEIHKMRPTDSLQKEMFKEMEALNQPAPQPKTAAEPLKYEFLNRHGNVERNKKGETPLDQMCKSGDLEGIKALGKLEKTQIRDILNNRDSQGMGALHHACASGDIKTVRALLEMINHAGVNVKDLNWAANDTRTAVGKADQKQNLSGDNRYGNDVRNLLKLK